MAIVRGFSFRVGPPVTVTGVEKALSGLPVGDGILLHRVVQVQEDGHLVFVEMHIGDPVTLDRIELARRRVSQALEYGFLTSPQPAGLDAGAHSDPYVNMGFGELFSGPPTTYGGVPVEDPAFQRELDKIKTKPIADQLADTLSGGFEKLTQLVQGAGLLAVGVGIVVLVLALRR